MHSLRKLMPWWFRLIIKVILARLPVPYAIWKRIGVFELGAMDKPQRALHAFLTYAKSAALLPCDAVDAQAIQESPMAGRSVLEIGPGDSLFTALVARSLGCGRCWLVDSGDFAVHAIGPYIRMTRYLRTLGFPTSWGDQLSSRDALLSACDGTYLTQGLESLRRMSAESIDFCFSNAVLEHIPKKQFDDFLVELTRVLRPAGVAVHRVDLTDHLGGGLNNLRFSEEIWESAFFSESGFYTNRMRFSEMLASFERAGNEVSVHRLLRWDALPLPRGKMDIKFHRFDEEDLLVYGFDVIVRKSGN